VAVLVVYFLKSCDVEQKSVRPVGECRRRRPATAGTPVQILERFRRLLSTQSFNGLGPQACTLTISGGRSRCFRRARNG